MFFGFVKLFFQKSLNPALFFLAQCCLFSSGFVGNGYGLCSIINGFQRVDLFGVSRNPEVGTFLYFQLVSRSGPAVIVRFTFLSMIGMTYFVPRLMV